MKKAVVYGGGNIGRGFLGQILYENGYEIVFVDVVKAMIERINQTNSYPIRIVSNECQNEITVTGCRAVTPDGAPDEIADSDILFTSAGVKVLPLIAPVIREGLEKRKGKGVDIIICENLLHVDRYLSDLVKGPENVGFVEASVGRMVPVMTPEMQDGDIARVWVEPFCTLYVDRDGFKNPVPEIRGIVPSSPFEYHIQSKLFLHNMGHAIAAYRGLNKGYEFIWEAMEDPDIASNVKEAMYASAEALSEEFGVERSSVTAYADDLMSRFRNRYLGDTCRRVGRDPERKLAPDDRLLGAIKLCLKHGIKTDAIKKGVDAALDHLVDLQ